MFLEGKKYSLVFTLALGLAWTLEGKGEESSQAVSKVENEGVESAERALMILSDSVQAIESRMFNMNDVDGADEGELQKYYSGIKQDYVLHPMRSGALQMIKSLENYQAALKRAYGKADNIRSTDETTMADCLASKNEELDNAISRAIKSLKLSTQMSQANAPRAMGATSHYVDFSTGARLADASSEIAKINKIDPSEFLRRCYKAENGKSDETEEQKKKRLADRAEQRAEIKEVQQELVAAQNGLDHDMGRIAAKMPSIQTPDPMGTRLTPFQIAQVLRNGALQSIFRNLRTGPYGAMQEQQIWNSIMPTCEREKEAVLAADAPWKAGKQILKQIANDAICSYLPSYGTAKWKASKAQATIGIAAMLSQTGLIHCDMETLQALAMQRTPEADLARLNFDALRDPPYIQQAFNMLPYPDPTGGAGGSVVLPDGSLLSNSGWYGHTLAPTNQPFTALDPLGRTGTMVRDPASTGVTASGAISSIGQPARVAASRGKGAVGNLGAMLGQQTAAAVKNAVSSIRSKGAQALTTAKNLKNAAQAANKMLGQVTTQQDTHGADGTRRSRSKFSAAVRGAVQKLAMAVGSTQTVKDLKNAIGATGRGDGTSVFGSNSSSNSSVGQLSNTIENNRQRKNQNVFAAQQIMSAIQTAVGKSAEYVEQIRKYALSYKQEIAKAEEKVLGASPPDQQKISLQLNRKLDKIVTDMAPLYAAYHAIGPAINESYMMLQRLYGSVGQGVPNIPGIGALAGVGTSPQGFPTAFSTAPTTPATTAPGTSTFAPKTSFLRRFELKNVLTALLGVPTAMADAQLEKENAWAAEWQLFVQQYEAYAKLREERSNEELKNAVDMWNNAYQAKATETAELSPDQIDASRKYSEALRAESEVLMTQFLQEASGGDKKSEYEIKNNVRETIENAKQMQEKLDRSERAYLKNYPVTSDDYLMGWERLLTTMILESGN